MEDIHSEKYIFREYMILKKYLIREYMVHGRYTF